METTAFLTAVPDASATDWLMRSRRSTRAFRPDAVSRELLVEILEMASLAPSTFNTQPWRVHLLTGAPKRALSDAILAAHAAGSEPDFSPFPQPPVVECSERQQDFGRRYYASLGIARSDAAARGRQTARNFEFFDAPVGLIFTIDARLTQYSWVDCGLFLQNLMLAAHARGLATCPQVSFVRYEAIIAAQLRLSAQEAVVCGMSLGYPNERAPVNRVPMPREPLERFSRWHGFPND
jgi:nitroreductase